MSETAGAKEHPGDGAAGKGDRSLLDDLVDYGLYAPLGAAIRVAGELPGLLGKGRARVESRVGTARAVGQFAFTQVRRRVERAFSAPPPPEAHHERPSGVATGGAGEPRATAPPATAPPATAPPAGAAGLAPDGDVAAGSARSAPRARRKGSGREAAGADAARPAPVVVSAPQAEGLPIQNYDSLAASQVVPRLAGLSAAELEAVRRYETAHRRRRTVLSRVAQLQGTPGEAR